MYKVMYRAIYFLPWLILSLAIIYFSNQETVEFLNDPFYMEDKILHFTAYFIYGLTIQFALINSTNYNSKKYYITIVLIGALFGLTDEIHQYFIPGRSSDILDWIADLLGICFSLVFKNAILWLRNRVELFFS